MSKSKDQVSNEPDNQNSPPQPKAKSGNEPEDLLNQPITLDSKKFEAKVETTLSKIESGFEKLNSTLEKVLMPKEEPKPAPKVEPKEEPKVQPIVETRPPESDMGLLGW